MNRIFIVVFFSISLLVVRVTVTLAQASTPPATPVASASPAPALPGRAGGNAFDLIPMGEPGKISVVIIGSIPTGLFKEIPFVLRNNTNRAVQDVEVIATVRTREGRLFAVGEASVVRPYRIEPGSIGLGSLDFEGVTIPADATYEFAIQSEPVGMDSFTLWGDMAVVSAEKVQNRIVGEARNIGEATATLVGVTVMCLSDHDIVGHYLDFIPQDSIPPGQAAAFQVIIGEPCDKFLVAAA